MRCRDDHAARAEMIAHMLGKPRLRGRVESSCRLVEQPKRALGDKQPRQCDAPLLSGGKHGQRQLRDVRQAEARQCVGRLEALPQGCRPPASTPKRRDYLAPKGSPCCRPAWPDIMRDFADGRRIGEPPHRDPTRRNGQQTGERAQKRRFSGAVRAGDDQRLARMQNKAQRRRERLARRARPERARPQRVMRNCRALSAHRTSHPSCSRRLEKFL